MLSIEIEELQIVFDHFKSVNTPLKSERVATALGINRTHAARICSTLADRELLKRRSMGRKGRLEYYVSEKGWQIESVSDPKAAVSLQAYGFLGRRFIDPWIANHPLVGQIPYSVSEQGIDAMKEWLIAASRQRRREAA